MANFQRTGRGILATKSLTVGQEILRIPAQLMLAAPCLDQQLKNALGQTGLDGAALQDVELALTLLMEAELNNGSAWNQYAAEYLPSPPHALGWSHEQLARLKHTAMYNEIEEARAELLQLWRSRIRPALLLVAPGRKINFRRFLWAYSLVESRELLPLSPLSLNFFELFPSSTQAGCPYKCRKEKIHHPLSGGILVFV